MFPAGLLIGALGAILWLALEPPSADVIDVPTVGLILLLTGVLMVSVSAVRAPRRRSLPAPSTHRPVPTLPTGPPLSDPDAAAPRRPVWEQTGYSPSRPAAAERPAPTAPPATPAAGNVPLDRTRVLGAPNEPHDDGGPQRSGRSWYPAQPSEEETRETGPGPRSRTDR